MVIIHANYGQGSNTALTQDLPFVFYSNGLKGAGATLFDRIGVEILALITLYPALYVCMYVCM